MLRAVQAEIFFGLYLHLCHSGSPIRLSQMKSKICWREESGLGAGALVPVPSYVPVLVLRFHKWGKVHLKALYLRYCYIGILSPVYTTRVDGPSTRLVETARPSTRPVLTGNGKRSPVNSGRQLV